MKNTSYGKGIVWNYPINASYKTTSIFGWPRLTIWITGMDFFGRNVIYGYGSLIVPLNNNQNDLYNIELYSPIGSSFFNDWINYISGNYPTFKDPNFISKSNDRGGVRVKRCGSARVKLHIELDGKITHLLSYITLINILLTIGFKEKGYILK